MHPINKLLSLLGLKLSRVKVQRTSSAYQASLEAFKRNPGRYTVFAQFMDENDDHPVSNIDFECAFASRHLSRLKPETLIDIGSYRHFVIGLLAHFQVTTIDVRERTPMSDNEIAITCDARSLKLHDGSFDACTSLCALEHIGLGRYGDELDDQGDCKALKEMVRVLKPGGRLIFSTTITRGKPQIAFNAHRIYSHDMIKNMCSNVGLTLEEERFFSNQLMNFCPYDEVTKEAKAWDIYLGCWKKSSQ